MTSLDVVQVALYLAAPLALVKPLGAYMAAVYDGRPVRMERLLGRVERWAYRAVGVKADHRGTAGAYARAFVWFNAVSIAAVWALLRCQEWLPGNPQHFAGPRADTAFNIAVSFVTNTNWQNYSGESTLSYFVRMAALAVQNFVSAAGGMAVAAALARGLRGRSAQDVGNFWVDLTRGILYILLPLSLVLALLLASQGVVENLKPYQTAHMVEGGSQVLPMGPAASQVAIKQLGTNGGGFFNVNSAHPFENATPFSNFLEAVAILLIPMAMCHTFGRMVGSPRQGWALLAAMTLIFVPCLAIVVHWEAAGNPTLRALGVAGPNLEGKEARFGAAASAFWATATTAASNGSVNSMHDSYLPAGGLVLLLLMQVGEVVYGGVGSGLFGMVVFAILTVFLCGLMVGRTPEYLGKRIEAYEMKMTSLAVLLPPLAVLVGTAIAVVTPGGLAGLHNRGPHGFSEILYAFSSMGNNNGSAFAGYGADTPLVNLVGGLAMIVGRYGVALPVLAMAGSLAAKKKIPVSPGTLPTDTPLFVCLLVGSILLVGALAFFPALALGPFVEHLRIAGG